MGGGVFWVGGGECRFYFYGRGDFSEKSQEARSDHGRKSPQPRDFAAAATTGHEGEGSKIGKSPKVARRGCKRAFGPTAQRSPKSPLHHVQPCFALVQPQAAPMQETFRSLGSLKAKSGNLNLFLRILPFFPLFPFILQGNKGKIRRKRFRLPDFAVQKTFCTFS